MAKDRTTIELYDDGDDKLRVVATRDDGVLFVAMGHVSWTERYWDPSHYKTVKGGDGTKHRQLSAKGARPRKMNATEIREYAIALLEEQAPGFVERKPIRKFRA